MIADVMVETLEEIVTTFNDANDGVVAKSGGGVLSGIRGAIGSILHLKISNLRNLGSGVLSGALGGIGGGVLGKLAGGLDFLKGFGALGGMNLDMSVAMTFISGVKAFYDCDTKKKCSDYQRDCIKGVKNMDKSKPDPNNIAKNVGDKVKDKIPEVGEQITLEDGTVGTVTAVREITPEQNLTRAQQLARERIESGRTIDEINQENLEAVREFLEREMKHFRIVTLSLKILLRNKLIIKNQIQHLLNQ